MIVTRFAPSPTGYLHIGGLRTALLSYLWARKNHGKFLLRIEDTDLSRNSDEATKAIIEAFDWVGLSYDGDVTYQSRRFDLYASYIEKLLESGHAYKCYMTKDELDALREGQQARGERPRYDGRWREGNLPIPDGVDPVIRIKAPVEGFITFNDGIKGDMKISAVELDDFIIARSDGTPTYNFVVAIDDALMGVTDVIRGDDHLSNTPKQILVYQALGFTIPRFFHVPMINNAEGRKLSKRDGATDVMEYKAMGYLPHALLNFLIRLGWSHGDQEIFSKDEMLALFDPSANNRAASSFNAEKLLWLNGHYIKNTPNTELAELLKFHDVNIEGHDKLEMILDTTKEKAKTLVELAHSVASIVTPPTSYDVEACEKFVDTEALNLLERLSTTPQGQALHLPSDYKAVFDAFLAAEGVKMPKVAQPLRLALVGTTHSPAVSDLLAMLGVEEITARITHFCQQRR